MTSPNPSLKGEELKIAVQILKSGGVVVYPTDTAYGLAVDATNLTAVKILYKLKGRNFNKPIHVIPPSKSSIGIFARLPAGRQELANKLINKLMPGPLTLVLPLKSKKKSFLMLSAGTKTLGIRLPKHSLVLKLVKAFGRPITTTSANISGKPNCYSIGEVKKQFGKNTYFNPYFNMYFLDGGKLKKTKPSTVVLLTGGRVKILREGPVSETEIKRILE